MFTNGERGLTFCDDDSQCTPYHSLLKILSDENGPNFSSAESWLLRQFSGTTLPFLYSTIFYVVMYYVDVAQILAIIFIGTFIRRTESKLSSTLQG